MKNESKLTKLISSLLIISIFIPVFVLFATPQKAEAIVGVEDTVEPGPIWGFILGLGTASNTATATATSATAITSGATSVSTGISAAANVNHLAIAWKDVLKEVVRQAIMSVERRILQQMTLATVKWINSGFHGSPLFLQDPQSFFKDIGKYEIKNLVSLTGYDPNRFPFGEQFALNTIASYKMQLADNAQYTLSKVINDPYLLQRYRNNFNAGGWNGFLINTQYPQNNYLGYNMMMQDELARKLQGTVQNAAQTVKTTLDQGMGFLSPKTCPSNPNYNNGTNEFMRPTFDPSSIPFPDVACDSDALQNEQLACQQEIANSPESGISGPCSTIDQRVQQCNDLITAAGVKWNADKAAALAKFNDPKGSTACPGGLKATTPGSVVANQITTAMGSQFRQSELGAALGNSISAILDALLSHFLDKGLSALGGAIAGTPAPDTFTYQGQNLGGGNNTGTSTGLSSSISNVSASTGSITTITISGGKAPYTIQTNSDASIAKTVVSPTDSTSFTIAGIKTGNTSITIKDSSTPALTITVPISITPVGSLVANPAKIDANSGNGISSGTITNVTISGGIEPYSIKTDSDQSIVTTQLSGTVLITVAAEKGLTSITIQDSSNPAQTVTIPITVQ